ncbi:MAG: hypothetical protein EKK71_01270 [Candidatus Competibacteraceae bacterium]|nr:MAG: hypothetical protein EKK71_01270 [Candidatus Competibacteraceae bacterium]
MQQLIDIQAGFEVPRYYILGVITQVDKDIIADRIDGSIGCYLDDSHSSGDDSDRKSSSSNTKKGTLGYSADVGTRSTD